MRTSRRGRPQAQEESRGRGQSTRRGQSAPVSASGGGDSLSPPPGGCVCGRSNEPMSARVPGGWPWSSPPSRPSRPRPRPPRTRWRRAAGRRPQRGSAEGTPFPALSGRRVPRTEERGRAGGTGHLRGGSASPRPACAAPPGPGPAVPTALGLSSLRPPGRGPPPPGLHSQALSPARAHLRPEMSGLFPPKQPAFQAGPSGPRPPH